MTTDCIYSTRSVFPSINRTERKGETLQKKTGVQHEYHFECKTFDVSKLHMHKMCKYHVHCA